VPGVPPVRPDAPFTGPKQAAAHRDAPRSPLNSYRKPVNSPVGTANSSVGAVGLSDKAAKSGFLYKSYGRFAPVFGYTAAKSGSNRSYVMSYIPGKEADFVEWSGNLIDVSKGHKTE
jgi:hypothetical protein